MGQAAWGLRSSCSAPGCLARAWLPWAGWKGKEAANPSTAPAAPLATRHGPGCLGRAGQATRR
eukprot:7149600-Alexandrium_andersonii.AAC.1